MTRRIGEVALTGNERSRRYMDKYPEKILAKSKAYYWANKDKIIAKRKAERLANRPAVEAAAALRLANRPPLKGTNKENQRAKSLAWKKANPEACREHSRRVLATPKGKLSNRIRAGIHNCIRHQKGGRTTESLVGWSIAELRSHLERQFTAGMTWDNMGEWHIDHIIPLASFKIDGPDDPELRRAWSLPNLRPLWAKDNMQKSNKIMSLL